MVYSVKLLGDKNSTCREKYLFVFVLLIFRYVQMEVAAFLMKKIKDLTVSVFLDGQDKHAWRILMTVR